MKVLFIFNFGTKFSLLGLKDKNSEKNPSTYVFLFVSEILSEEQDAEIDRNG